MRRRLPILGLFLALLLTPLVPGAILVPEYTGYVTDLAGAIPPREKAAITAIVEKVNRDTGAEIAVLTVLTTGGEDILNYTMAVAEAWKPGQKGKDNGILIVVATEDRKMYILVGYGLEGVLPDGKVGAIEDEKIIPYFKTGNYAAGILMGVMTIAEVVDPGSAQGRTELPPTTSTPAAPMPSTRLSPFDLIKMLVIAALFLYLAIRHPRLLLLLLLMGGGGGRRGRGNFGGGGFGGFSGGGFGGGGASRSW
jgi:uncharacterized protein